MQGFFTFLQQNPYLLLFFVVGLAVWIGRASIKGYGLGMVAGAIVVGAGLSVWASTYGVKLELNAFAKSLFYYLFMYGVGLRVGSDLFRCCRIRLGLISLCVGGSGLRGQRVDRLLQGTDLIGRLLSRGRSGCRIIGVLASLRGRGRQLCVGWVCSRCFFCLGRCVGQACRGVLER